MTRPGANAAVPTGLSDANAGIPPPTQGESVLSEFDRFRLGRVTRTARRDGLLNCGAI